jgi:predicted proteasome-type protease
MDGSALQASGVRFDVSFLFGGQIKGERPRLFMVYATGNFIECTQDTPTDRRTQIRQAGEYPDKPKRMRWMTYAGREQHLTDFPIIDVDRAEARVLRNRILPAGHRWKG